MNPNLIMEISELRRIYKQTKSIYQNQGYSYKNRVRQCTFTNNMLKNPVLMCKRGFLFNSEALLKALEKKNLPQRLNYIKNTADVRRVHLNPNKTKKNRFPFCCPLTAKVLNGLNPFVLVWDCGCLMYEKLLFPLASIKMSLEQIIQKRENDEFDEDFTNKKLKCPNCRKLFGLSSLFSLNLTSKRFSRHVSIVRPKSTKKKEVHEELGKNLLGKRERVEAEDTNQNEPQNQTKRKKEEVSPEDAQPSQFQNPEKASKKAKK